MREVRVVRFVVLCLVIVVLFVQGCVEQSDDSSGTGSAQAQTTSSTYGRYEDQSDSHRQDDVAQEEPMDQSELVEQAFDDISEAEVDQKTEDLKAAFRHLNEMCTKAVETRDALLSTRYAASEDEQRAIGKEADHGI